MEYFSGFCFENEQELFGDFLIKSDFCVAGFSYGAIKAFEQVYSSKNRVDTLQLFSPAFFQDRDEKFKRLQLMAFKKDKQNYLKNFYQNTLYPLETDIARYKKDGTAEELKELLNYKWDKEKLDIITKRGTKIEVYLGKLDKIINIEAAKEFFKTFATVYYFNRLGHIIQMNN